MIFNKTDKEQWHKFFPLFPVGTLDGKIVWLEKCYRRYRYIGFCADDFQGNGYQVEYCVNINKNERDK